MQLSPGSSKWGEAATPASVPTPTAKQLGAAASVVAFRFGTFHQAKLDPRVCPDSEKFPAPFCLSGRSSYQRTTANSGRSSCARYEYICPYIRSCHFKVYCTKNHNFFQGLKVQLTRGPSLRQLTTPPPSRSSCLRSVPLWDLERLAFSNWLCQCPSSASC